VGILLVTQISDNKYTANDIEAMAQVNESYIVGLPLGNLGGNQEDQGNIIVAYEQYLVANSKIEIPQPKVVSLNLPKQGIGNGWCVDYARYVTGLKYNGNAYLWESYINSDIPNIGSIVVLNEGAIGHLAVVIKIDNDTITISEQNYIGRYIISQRELPLNYKNIVGYVLKIN
jgi:hypothetical protein